MKQFFEQYGGVALGILAVLVLIAMITPVGNIIKTSLQGVAEKFSTQIGAQTDTALEGATYIQGSASEGPKYILSFNSNGGTAVDSQNVSRIPSNLPTPIKTGFTFGGWYTKSDLSQAAVGNTKLTEDTTLYAKWNLANYSITYNLNGGTLSGQKTSYTIADSAYTLPSPTKPGYDFSGWYDNSSFTGSPITTISAGSTGNKSFYAKWKLSISKTYKLKTGLKFNALIPSTTKSIVFTDEVMPANAKLIDVDADGDGGVVGWLDGTTFKASTQKSGQKIILNEDSSYMFCGSQYQGNKTTTTQNLVSIDFANVDTSSVTNMSYMFYYAGYNVTSWSIGDLSEWDTSNVTNMGHMFSFAGYNTRSWSVGDLSEWNTSNVTNMSSMFDCAGYMATSFNLDLSGWNTSNVTNMGDMFNATGYRATSWSIGDLSGWDTSNVTNMGHMFSFAGYNTRSWSVGDLSGWNTSNVTNMGDMFRYAGYSAIYKLNLSSWNVTKVTYHRDFNIFVTGKVIPPVWVS